MKILRRLRRILQPANSGLSDRLERYADRQLVLQAGARAQSNRHRTAISALYDVEFSASSQWGEDGIIDWLIDRIPGLPRTFVEFGVGDYRESNTRLLMQLRHWGGLVIDGSPQHIADIQSQEIYWRHEIRALQAFIDADNINELIGKGGMSGDIGLLSVDIDGNDYWVWKAISVINPALVVAEYNAVFGDIQSLTIPYRPDFQRGAAHHSMLYFGASLQALVDLGISKGYRFLGTGMAGCNAFFVRNDLYSHLSDCVKSIRAYPTLAREARDEHGNLKFTSGVARTKIIEALPVIDLSRNQEVLLSSFAELYSPEWRAGEAREF